MKKITTTDRKVYEYALENYITVENTNVNITPGVSCVYSYDVPEDVKAKKTVKHGR